MHPSEICASGAKLGFRGMRRFAGHLPVRGQSSAGHGLQIFGVAALTSRSMHAAGGVSERPGTWVIVSGAGSAFWPHAGCLLALPVGVGPPLLGGSAQ